MTDSEPGGDDAVELARLRAENDSLRGELASQNEQKEHRGARRWTSTALALLAAILVPLAVATVWVNGTALDTDQYVATVGPLARNEAVQDRIIEVLTERINEEVDFAGIVDDNLPEELSAISGPIAGGAEALVGRAVDEIVRSEAFATVWEEANRAGHEIVVAVLSGEGSDLIDTSDGQITVVLTPLLEQLTESLDGRLGEAITSGLGLTEIDAEIVLLEADELGQAQSLVSLLDTLSWAVPLAGIALLVAAVLVAADRRKGLRRVGLALMISSLVTLALLAVARSRVLSASVDEAAASAVFDSLTNFLIQALRSMLVLGIIVLLVAWVLGSSKSAGKTRAWAHALIGQASTVEDASAVGKFPITVARHRVGFLTAALVMGALALVLWTHPTGWVVIFIAIITLLAVAAVEVLARIGQQAVGVVDSIDVQSTETESASASAQASE